MCFSSFFFNIRSYFWDCFFLSEAYFFKNFCKRRKISTLISLKIHWFLPCCWKMFCWVYDLRLTVTFSPHIKAITTLSFGFYFVVENSAISVLICLLKVSYLWLVLRYSFNLWCSIVLLWCVQVYVAIIYSIRNPLGFYDLWIDVYLENSQPSFFKHCLYPILGLLFLEHWSNVP